MLLFQTELAGRALQLLHCFLASVCDCVTVKSTYYGLIFTIQVLAPLLQGFVGDSSLLCKSLDTSANNSKPGSSDTCDYYDTNAGLFWPKDKCMVICREICKSLDTSANNSKPGSSDTCDCYDTDAVLFWPKDKCMVICREICTYTCTFRVHVSGGSRI